MSGGVKYPVFNDTSVELTIRTEDPLNSTRIHNSTQEGPAAAECGFDNLNIQEIDKILDANDDDDLRLSGLKLLRNSVTQSGKIQNKVYIPSKVPPDWDMAEDHLKATSVGLPVKKPEGQPINVDEMSGRPVDLQPVPLCTPRENLSFLGPAYPMYFQFLLFVFGVLFFFLTISGIYAFITNSRGEFCKSDDVVDRTDPNNCILGAATGLSLANKKWTDTDSAEWQEKMHGYVSTQKVLNLICYVVLLCFFQYFRYRQRLTAKTCDDRDTSISDYTFEVRNIPKIPGADIRKEIWEFIEHNALPNEKVEVQKVVCCFDVADKVKLETEIDALVQTRAKLKERQRQGEPVNQELETAESSLNKLKQDLRKMQIEFAKGKADTFVGVAYVTVNTQKQYWDVINYWKRGYFPFWQKRQNLKSKPHMQMRGNLLEIQEAAEPSDVFWENLGVSQQERNRNTRHVNLICGGILLLCFAGVLGMYQAKGAMIASLGNGSSGTSSLSVQAISYFTSFVIVMINYVLQFAIRKLTFWEKHPNWTNYYTSVATKLAWAQFFNTSIITFAVALISKNYWGTGGMIESIISVFQVNAFYTPLYNLANIWYWIGKCKRSRAKGQGDQSFLTQKEAMALFEYPKFDFATSYSALIKSAFSAAFYAPVVPIALVWTLVSIVLCYWVDKYNNLRAFSVGKALGSEIAIQMIEIMEWSLVIFGVSSFVFDYIIFDHESIFDYIILGIALINAFFPMEWLNVKIFGEVKPDVYPETYNECKLDLDEEYDRFNPATKEMAVAKYTKLMQEGSDKGEKRIEKFLRRNKLK